MYIGFASLAALRFLLVGFWVVMAVGVGLGLVYVVGSTRGRRAAQLWVNLCVAALVVGGVGDIAWAVATGQWQRFLLMYGFGPLGEMLMLAALFLGTMWFMALRYTQGLKD